MTRLQFFQPDLAKSALGTTYRFDTSLIVDSPAAVGVLGQSSVLAGSTLTPQDTVTPNLAGPDGVFKLYRKQLDATGTPTGTPVVLTGVDTSVRSAPRGTDWLPVSFHAHPPNDGLSAVGNLSCNLRTSHRSPFAVGSEVDASFSNVQNVSGVETDGPNSITVRAAVEYPAGTYTPLTFNGRRDIVIDPGGTVRTDPLAIDIPAATQFWIRTKVLLSDTTTQKYPLYGSTRGSLYGEGSSTATTDVDMTTSGTFTPSDSAFGFGPSQVRVRRTAASAGLVAVAGVGDSIMKGAGDFPDSVGWFGRLFADAPFQKISYSSDLASSFATFNGRRRRLGLLRDAQFAVCNYGVNDVWNASRSFAQVQADLLKVWQILAGMGMKVWQGTLTTKNTSTDSWATPGNQTVNGTLLAVRNQVNAWIRTVPAPLAGYLEVADWVETGRDTGIWKNISGAITGDGLHPNGNGYQAIADGNAGFAQLAAAS